MATTSDDPDPEDLLSDSLQLLYDYTPIVHSSAGSEFIYTTPKDLAQSSSSSHSSPSITLITPTTQAENWSLHASSIWTSSIFLADHLPDLQLTQHISGKAEQTNDPRAPRKLRVLELGAGAGLPSILIAKSYEGVEVITSDYPDPEVIKALKNNVARNDVVHQCQVVSYAWGSDPSVFRQLNSPDDQTFDVIIAADTLWNSQLHLLFLDSLHKILRRSGDARIYLVAGLHTGRYTLQAFMDAVSGYDFEFEEIVERAVNGLESRPWDVERQENEDDKERRRWVVWMVLKWTSL